MSTNTSNKVLFGLKNVHYAIRTVSNAGVVSYGTPKALAGAVSIGLNANSDINKFYADNIQYYVDETLAGYEGDLEIAKLTDEALKDIWGLTEGTTSKVLSESVNVEPNSFCLLFQIDGDQHSVYHVFYNCVATRPSVEANTVTETKEPKTQTLNITISPEASGLIHAKTTADTPSATINSWFTTVFVEGAVTGGSTN